MSNLLLGIFTVSFCSIGYFYSWRHHTKDNYKIAVLLLVLCGFALRMYISCDFFLHSWDERYHALVAKNLIQHPLIPTLYDNPILPYDYKSWITNHIWVHKQPLPLWTMAASLSLFGINEIALRLPSIILTTIGIWLTFSIGSYLFNKKVGYLAAFLYSINGLIIELTGGRVPTDHIDTFFLFFVELAVFFTILFAQKKKFIYNILTGISLGAAILSKWLPALIILPIWLLIIYESGNFKIKEIIFHFIIMMLVGAAVFIPWQLYIYRVFPVEASWESGFNMNHITQVLENQTGPPYYFINKIRINYGELIYLPMLWFFWKTIINLKDYKRVAICIWFLLPFLFFSFVKTKMQAYLLFTSPTIFMITADFFFMLSDYKRDHKPKWVYNLILLLLICLPIRYTIERVKPFEKIDRNPLWAIELRKLNKQNLEKRI
jgi:4-amino-4-deoxy-L-arabinose transferase